MIRKKIYLLLIVLIFGANIYYVNTFNSANAVDNKPNDNADVTKNDQISTKPLQNQNVSQSSSNLVLTSSLADVIDKIAPAVVNISSVRKVSDKSKNFGLNPPETMEDLFKFFMNPPSDGMLSRPTVAVGSGFIIDTTGYIVTNYHVIKDASEINVYINNDKTKKYVAKVIGKDPQTDLALIKIDSNGISLPYLEFADSDKARVGDFVIAIGNPFGLGGTVTQGIISAKSRSIDEYSMDEFIQTDASINVGNSGGPLCDLNGNVLGINSVIYSQSGGNVGIGFAITSNMAQPIINQLKSKGSIERGFIGVKVQMVTEDIAKSLSMPEVKGALINDVTKDSPAEKIGLKIGDVIISFNNKDVKNISQLVRFVSNTPIGKDVPIQIWRGGKVVNMTIAVKKRSPKEEDDAEDDDSDAEIEGQAELLGMTLVNVNDDIKQKYNLSKDTKGVMVVNISQNSPVIMSGIRPGDILISIDQKTFGNLKEMDKVITDIKQSGKSTVLLLLMRNENTQIFTTINLNDIDVHPSGNDNSDDATKDQSKDDKKKGAKMKMPDKTADTSRKLKNGLLKQ